MAIRTFRRRIGITGLARSGKTVFLTSLINHLKYHNSKSFRIGKKGNSKIEWIKGLEDFKTDDLPAKVKNKKFNYIAYRDRLKNEKKWPEKTMDYSLYICSFNRTDWHTKDAELEFFDFPGERMADVAMVDEPDFSAWSNKIIDTLSSYTEYEKHAGRFLEMLKMDSINPEELIKEYKLTLARLIKDCKPLITPSTFLLGVEGDQPENLSAEEIANSRYCGKSSFMQFIPLSSKVANAHPDLFDACSKNYNEYRKEIVLPIFDHLKKCNSLIVLIDVTTILAAGYGMFNDNISILESLINVSNPGEDIKRKTASLVSSMIPKWDPGWITRIAFIATKLDKVHHDDRNNVLQLLKQMVPKRAEQIKGLTTEYFTCSAIVSTQKALEKEHHLAGFPISYNSDDLSSSDSKTGMVSFPVSRVPEKWPPDLEQNSYVFPDVHPIFPKLDNEAPKHIQLDKIFDFIMETKHYEES